VQSKRDKAIAIATRKRDIGKNKMAIQNGKFDPYNNPIVGRATIPDKLDYHRALISTHTPLEGIYDFHKKRIKELEKENNINKNIKQLDKRGIEIPDHRQSMR